ncbi:DNA-processing protein DprA [Hyphomicrobium methylovorum]|uniref:DNA-processing protein DprA n=1 Tax=Hyphomicrobium methylovorum TaxID=84 RepID=UPI0031B61BF2
MPKPEQPELFTPAPLPFAKLSDAERLSCLRLIRSENVGPVTFRELINHFGGATQALNALPELSRRGGSGRTIRLCSVADAERELDAASRVGATPVFTIEPNYPAMLASIEAPPPLVYLKGRTDIFSRPAVAIVGSRQCSAAGVELARRFSHTLSNAGFVVVSGLARGIDRAAHDAALKRGTVAVLAGGIDWIYPPEHAALQQQIGEEGCLITERPPGIQARAADFPRRNRIIAGLVYGVVVIEAAMRSGTLVTARYANELGREVFALPSHPLDPRGEGTNRLIKQGATMVTDPQEVVDMLQPMIDIDDLLHPEPEPAPSARHSEDLSAEPHATRPTLPQQTTVKPVKSTSTTAPRAAMTGPEELTAVLAALGPAPVAIDALARAVGLPAQRVQAVLLELDLAGRIVRQGQGLIALRTANEEL